MGGGWLEVGKLALYVSLPVGLTLAFATRPENLEAAIKNVRVYDAAPHVPALTAAPQRAYVVYPPAGPRPPTGEELHTQRRAG